MKRTIGRVFDAKLYVYNKSKYIADPDAEVRRVIIHDVEAWEVVRGERAEAIEAETDGSNIDDNHEYLVLYHENGETSTFRNSYVDMFIR